MILTMVGSGFLLDCGCELGYPSQICTTANSSVPGLLAFVPTIPQMQIFNV